MTTGFRPCVGRAARCAARAGHAPVRRPPSGASLRCSAGARVAELAAFTSFTPLKQLRRVSARSTPVLRQACLAPACASRRRTGACPARTTHRAPPAAEPRPRTAGREREGMRHPGSTMARGRRRIANRRGRAAQRQAGRGPRMFERSEFARTPPAASSAGKSRSDPRRLSESVPAPRQRRARLHADSPTSGRPAPARPSCDSSEGAQT